MRYATWIVVVVLLASPAGRAQTVCNPLETIGKCQERLNSQPVKSELQAKPSTADVADSAMKSSKKDFLPTLLAALQTAKLDSQKQELDLAWNFHPSKGDLQVQSVIHQPQVFQDLQKKLNDMGASAKLSELQSGLNDLGDVSLGVSFNFENGYFGRRFENYRSLFTPLLSTAIDQVKDADDRLREAIDERNELLRNLTNVNLEENVVGSIPESQLRNIEAAMLKVAEANAEFESQETKTLQGSALSTFSNLVDNQPQLHFTASYRSRAHEVGPDEISAQASFEYGFVSATGYKSKVDNDCPKDKNGKQAPACALKTFRTYAAGAKAGDRLTLTAEYHRTQSYSLHAATDGADISVPQADRKTISLDYGRRVWFDDNGGELARIELKGTYENFSDDPAHQDRLVFDFSYIQKVSDTFSFPIGISYANHSYFLGDVQKRFSAHFGLHAKIFNGS